MAAEVAADALGEEWEGYVVQSVMGPTHRVPQEAGSPHRGRVHLLLSKGQSCYRPRRTGESTDVFGVAL